MEQIIHPLYGAVNSKKPQHMVRKPCFQTIKIANCAQIDAQVVDNLRVEVHRIQW